MKTEHSSPKRPTNWDRVSALSALVVGCAALFVSAFTAYEEHRHGQAEVWPQLTSSLSDRDGEFQLDVANKGLGPAIVRDARISVDGHPTRTWKEYVEAYVGHPVHGWEIEKSDLVGRTLLSGEAVALCSAGGEIAQAFLTERGTGRHLEEISICYCSVFDDCWIRDRKVTRPVARCSAPSEDSIVPASQAEIADNFEQLRKLRLDAGKAADGGP